MRESTWPATNSRSSESVSEDGELSCASDKSVLGDSDSSDTLSDFGGGGDGDAGGGGGCGGSGGRESAEFGSTGGLSKDGLDDEGLDDEDATVLSSCDDTSGGGAERGHSGVNGDGKGWSGGSKGSIWCCCCCC